MNYFFLCEPPSMYMPNSPESISTAPAIVKRVPSTDGKTMLTNTNRKPIDNDTTEGDWLAVSQKDCLDPDCLIPFFILFAMILICSTAF